MPLTTVSPGLLDTDAQYYGFKNRLINGLCTVQQRAAVAISGAYQYGVVDRWAASGGGTPTAGSITSFAAGSNTLSGQALAITNYSSSGTGTVPTVQQRIEQKNCFDLRSSTVTISALVYQDTGTTITYAFNLAKFGSVDVYSGATSLGSATMQQATVPSGVWTRIIGTFTFGANDCSNGIAVGITSNSYNTTITTKNFYFSEMQLEKGSVMTSFDYRPYGTELALCQRYYYRRTYENVSDTVAAMSAYGPGAVWGKLFDLPVEMRATPTGSISSIGHFRATNTAGSAAAAFTGGSIGQGTTRAQVGTGGWGGSSGLTAGYCVNVIAGTAGAWVDASAEL